MSEANAWNCKDTKISVTLRGEGGILSYLSDVVDGSNLLLCNATENLFNFISGIM